MSIVKVVSKEAQIVFVTVLVPVLILGFYLYLKGYGSMDWVNHITSLFVDDGTRAKTARKIGAVVLILCLGFPCFIAALLYDFLKNAGLAFYVYLYFLYFVAAISISTVVLAILKMNVLLIAAIVSVLVAVSMVSRKYIAEKDYSPDKPELRSLAIWTVMVNFGLFFLVVASSLMIGGNVSSEEIWSSFEGKGLVILAVLGVSLVVKTIVLRYVYGFFMNFFEARAY